MFSPEKGTDKMLTQQSVHLLHSKTNKQTNKQAQQNLRKQPRKKLPRLDCNPYISSSY